MTLKKYEKLSKIAKQKFNDIIVNTKIHFLSLDVAHKLRIYLIDDTVLDIWLSEKGKYSYHWEQRNVRDYIHRHDNSGHLKWKHIPTFPKHFHNGKENNVIESKISDNPEKAIVEFLNFIKTKME